MGRPGPGLELASPVSMVLTETDLDTGGVTLILGLVAVSVKLVESTEGPGGCWKSMESNRDWPSEMISMLAMSSVSGMLITLLVVESASSPTYFCGNDRAGAVSDWSDVSMGSESGGGLGLGDRVGAG